MQAEQITSTNVVDFSTRRPVPATALPAPSAPSVALREASAESILLGALLMAIREEQPEMKNRRWLGICHHAERFASALPQHGEPQRAIGILRAINEDAHTRYHDRGLD